MRSPTLAVSQRLRSLLAAAARLPLPVLLLAGAVARLVQYGFNRSFWYDEALLANIVVDTPLPDLLGSVSGAPAGFVAAARLAATALGPHDWVLRLVPLAAGLGTVVVASRLARIAFDSTAARAAFAGLLCLGPPLVYYASEFKPYGADVLSTLLLWTLGASFRRTHAGRDAATLAAAGIACLAFSFTSVFVMAAVGTVLAIDSMLARHRASLPALAGTGLAWSAAVAGVYFGTLRGLERNDWLDSYWAAGYAPSPLSHPGWYPDAFLQLVRIAFGTAAPIAAGLRPDTFPVLTAAVGVLVVAGLAAFLRRRPRLFAMIALSVLGTVAASAAEAYPFRSRLVLFLVPAVFVGLAAIVDTLAAGGTRVQRAAAALLAAGLLAQPGLTIAALLVRPANQSDLKGALSFVVANRQPGDLLAMSVWSRPAFGFYARDFGVDEMETLPFLPPVDPAQAFLAAVRQRPVRTSRVWLLFSHRFNERFRFFSIVGRSATRGSEWEGDGAGAYLVTFPAAAP